MILQAQKKAVIPRVGDHGLCRRRLQAVQYRRSIYVFDVDISLVFEISSYAFFPVSKAFVISLKNLVAI